MGGRWGFRVTSSLKAEKWKVFTTKNLQPRSRNQKFPNCERWTIFCSPGLFGPEHDFNTKEGHEGHEEQYSL